MNNDASIPDPLRAELDLLRAENVQLTSAHGHLQAELGRSQLRLDESQAIAHIGSWEWDLRQDRITWTDELYRLYGLARGLSDITFEQFVDLVHPADRERVRVVIQHAFEAHQPFSFDHRFVPLDGDERVLEARGRVELDPTGEVIRMVGTSQDVSAARRVEGALRQAEARYRLLADNSTDIISLSDPMGVITYVSPATLGLLGYTPEELIGRSAFELVHPDDTASAFPPATVGQEVELVTYRVKRKDGSYVWIEARVRQLVDPETGVAQTLANSRDVSDRKRAEEALWRSNAVLRAQQEAGIDGVLVVDEHQRVISFNQRFLELWGIPASVIAGHDDQELLGHVAASLRDPAEFQAKVTYLYQHPGETSRDEIYLADGRVFDRYSAAAMSPQGVYFGRIWYFRDITDRKALEARLQQKNEQLEELNRLQTNFVHSVSHELRTPLTSIVGYAEFLEDSLVDPDEVDLLDFVHQIQLSTKRLQRLLDDLLDFALMEAGTFQLKCEATEFGEKIREIAESFRPQVAQAGLRLDLALPEEPLELVADPQRLGQVLTNFIGNAVKLTPSGGRILVRALMRDERMCVEVVDTGPGIRTEDLPRLFQRFSQLESGLRRGGAGLGLSISKGLVEAHGGTIGVDSQPGHGATFWFTLPLDGA